MKAASESTCYDVLRKHRMIKGVVWEVSGNMQVELAFPSSPAVCHELTTQTGPAAQGDAAPSHSGDLGVSYCRGHPHSSPVALRASILPVLWATTLAHLLSYREVPCANSILGGVFWELASSLQLCESPHSLQYSSATGSRVNRNNRVHICWTMWNSLPLST